MSPGAVLGGKYRLISLIGRGGMGSVWRAERLGWQAPVAIKLMNVAATQDAQSLARFRREARLVAGLRSVHVVQVLDDGIDEETSAPFIVMELLEGETLAERLARVRCMRPPVVAQIISQIARALSRAHDAGLIHRDLKPDNVLLVRNDDEEVVKVLDFGIAKWMSSPHKLSHGTFAGQMLGTPAYMSPEQFTNPANIDQRADLWSLGVIACECMAGARPFEGETLVTLAVSICSGEPRVPSSIGPVPDGFDAWFARALKRDPEARFPSARVMAEELRGLCGQMPMLWEPEAAAPPIHATREHTELEPVLELTRRMRIPGADQPTEITDLESVLPLLRTEGPSDRRSGLWFALVAVVAAVAGALTVLAPELGPIVFADLSNQMRRITGGADPSAETPSAVSSSPVASSPLSPPRGPVGGAYGARGRKRTSAASASAPSHLPEVDAGVSLDAGDTSR